MLVSKGEMDATNEQQIRTLADFMEICEQTVEDAEEVIEDCTNELEVVNANIEEQEDLRDEAAEDRDLA